jgi:hypothetical protein
MSEENQQGQKRRRKRKQLRGDLLVEAALHALANHGSWNGELTWEKLEERIGVSRQSLSKKAAIKEAFDSAKKVVSSHKNTAKAIVRRDAESRIKSLREEVQRLNKVLDAFLEKWLQMEWNCKELRIDPKRILGDRPDLGTSSL